MNDLQKKYIAALRSNWHRQCRNRWFANGKCCALGLLAEIVFPGKSNLNFEDINQSVKEIGMSVLIANKVIEMNDSDKSFNDIAYYLESTPCSFY